ncbi:MAG: hypothetical protein KF795_32530 [Labilithrix sp.]|nr:hypothetical protein [Labilithrix sp.]
MSDLARAVDDLVSAATRAVEPRALKSVVEKVLDGFDEAPAAARDAALKAIGRALGKVDGRGAQILSLALGALVESGASPELAWPAVARNLAGLLDDATAFARAAVLHAKDDHVDTAVEASGAAVAKKKPREAEAWKALPSRCLAAVACLTRSKTLRARSRKDVALQEAAWPLSDVVSEVGYLLQALRIVDDETLLVLAPDAQRGWRVTVDAMPSNAELYVLLADALGAAKARDERLLGKRPDPKAVAAIREGGIPPKSASSVKLPFHLVAWTAVASDGSLPPADLGATEHHVWMEGIPADIPAGPGKERVVLLQTAPRARPIPVAPSFESLRPEVRVSAELPAAEVARVLRQLGRAASRTHAAHDEAPPKKKAAPAKGTPKKKAAPAKGTPKKKAAPAKGTPKKKARKPARS